MKEMLRNLLVLPCILQSRADVEARKRLFKSLSRKDLELISKGEQLPAWSNGCDTIERFELPF